MEKINGLMDRLKDVQNWLVELLRWAEGQTDGLDREKQTNIQYINADRPQPKQSKEPFAYYTVTNLIKSRKWQTKSQFLLETNTLKLPGFSITSGNWDRQISTAKSHACLPGKKGERKTWLHLSKALLHF